MRRVCCFCETWASGGIESFLCKLLSQMDQTDLQIDVVAVRVENSIFTEELEKCGVHIEQLSGSKFRWLSNCLQFWSLLKERNYDVIHLNVFQGLQLLYLYLAKLARVPVRIAHSHGSDLRKSPIRWIKMLLHRIGKSFFGQSATVRWACSGQASEFLFGNEEMGRVIPNGINTERYRFRPDERERIRAELDVEEKFVIGSVGRLQYDKNQSFLLDVLVEMLPQRPESVLLLVGDGAARQELQRKAETLGIANRVIFYGLSDRVEELLWAMDAFAFPSLSEGLGLVAVEAQAAGLPMVCSEYIPKEAVLTPLFQRVPLTNGAAEWAQVLLNAKCCCRENQAEAVRQAGYEIFDTAKTVRTEYLRK